MNGASLVCCGNGIGRLHCLLTFLGTFCRESRLICFILASTSLASVVEDDSNRGLGFYFLSVFNCSSRLHIE